MQIKDSLFGCLKLRLTPDWYHLEADKIIAYAFLYC